MEIMFNESMSKDNLISVIVPVFNIEPFITNCLNSILNQTYQNIEIIAIDDGSSDQSGLILDRYKEQYPARIRVLHTENRGVFNARLSGIEIASGEWIGFVDGDDEIEPDMYERLIQNAIKYSADISHCGYQTIVNGGERIHYFYNTGVVIQQDRQTGLKDLLQGEFIEPSLCNKLFKRHLFKRILGDSIIDPHIRLYEDLLMNFFLFCDATVSVYEDFCPYHYLARTNSVTRSQFHAYKVLDPVQVESIILNYVDDSLKDLAWKRYLDRCAKAYIALYRADVLPDKQSLLRKKLIKNKNKWKTLPFKSICNLFIIVYMPKQYYKVRKLYSKLHKSEKKYE